jgi:hypothetical protein
LDRLEQGEIVEDEGGEDGEFLFHRYYFLTTKAPDNKALDSFLDRAGQGGRSHELPPDSDEGKIIGFTFKRNESNPTRATTDQ